MKLFEVQFMVEVKVDHPWFYQVDCGYLVVWLYADNKADAVALAVQVARRGPFEIVGQLALAYPAPGSWTNLRSIDQIQKSIAAAKITGFSSYLIGIEIGTATGDFQHQWEGEEWREEAVQIPN